MNKTQLFILFLSIALVAEQVTAHTPLSMVRAAGHWALKPFRAMRSFASGLHLVPLKHFAKKAIIAKKLVVLKGALIAKPLIAKAVLAAKALPGRARSSEPATTQLPLLQRLMPRQSLPQLVMPVRLAVTTASKVTTQQRQETISPKM